MVSCIEIPITNHDSFADKLCLWLQGQEYGVVLRNNGYSYNSPLCDGLNRYELIAGVAATQVIKPERNKLAALRNFKPKGLGWLFGYLGYDLKNEIERLESNNPDGLLFPDLLFFEPRIIFALKPNSLVAMFCPNDLSQNSVEEILKEIEGIPTDSVQPKDPILVTPRFSRNEYIDTVGQIKEHLHRGDLYEVTFCQEFYAQGCRLDPYTTFNRLNAETRSSFAAFGCFNGNYIMCGSPERFLQRNGNLLTSQPIKGTSRRGNTPQEDAGWRSHLASNPKERAENIMIVDLVRNDLARVAIPGTVRVDELCGIYPFRQVNQMISTVSCQIPEAMHIGDIIRATFPMGSMTGAPKVKAMELIERYERTRRGLFSGALGYIEPNGNFDFNVVIRSILYSQSQQYLSYSVGSAITMQATPEDEYEECLLKATAIARTLGVEQMLV